MLSCQSRAATFLLKIGWATSTRSGRPARELDEPRGSRASPSAAQPLPGTPILWVSTRDTRKRRSELAEHSLQVTPRVAVSRSVRNAFPMTSSHEGAWTDGIDIDIKEAAKHPTQPTEGPSLEVLPTTWAMEFSKDEEAALDKLRAVMRRAESKEDVIRLALKIVRLALTREVALEPRSLREDGVVVRLWV